MHPHGGVNAYLRTVQMPSMPAATLACPCLLRLSAQPRRFACSDGGRNKGQAIVPFRISFAGYAMPAQQQHGGAAAPRGVPRILEVSGKVKLAFSAF
jgi:hypothetical protein